MRGPALSGTAPDRLAVFRADLDGLAAAARQRRLIARAGVDFASNDYLGLAGASRLRDAVRVEGGGVPSTKGAL